ncbi:MAG: SRPBCC family protein [Parvularculaceae bacterium]|nr:SRPBCC family protein [Parvularculaceae bacterium]
MRRILIGVFAFAVIVVGLGFLLPDRVHVERSVMINAPREEVFARVADFRRWNEWSPWADLDPKTAYEISGSGLGSRMVWSSTNPKVGSGSQEIVGYEPPSVLKTKLDFGGNGGGEATMTLIDEHGATKVVWTLDTRMRAGVPVYMQPVGTYMGFFMDGMIGKDYEKGLAKLKAAAESR